MNEDIAKLKYWLTLRGNSQVKLAGILGYTSSIAIDNWIARDRIARNRLLQVMEIIENDIAKSSKARESKKTTFSPSVRRGRVGKDDVRSVGA